MNLNFFNKSKRCYFNNKKIINILQQSFLSSQPVGSVEFLTTPIFFINPARFQPRVSRVPGQPIGPSFKSMIFHEEKYSSHYKISLVSIIVCIPVLLFQEKKRIKYKNILNERCIPTQYQKKKL
jgi:hypothetical protein